MDPTMRTLRRYAAAAPAVLLLLAGLAAAVGASHAVAQQKRPNVLFIAVDDLNHWVGYLGRNKQTRTPNLDRLAARGVRFTRSYCAAPLCNPSRAALMSGLRPNQSGVYDNNNDWRTAIGEDLPLTTAFRRAGYYVGGTGKIYHEAFPRRSEWDDYLGFDTLPQDPRQRSSGGVGGIRFQPLTCRDEELRDYQITSWTIEQLGKRHDRPFFLALGLQLPHMPWAVPQKYFDQFPLEKIQLPPVKEDDLNDVPPAGVRMARPEGDHAAMVRSGRWKEAVQAYLAAIAFTDMNIGRVIAALDRSPHRDNTILVLWGDHGWHLGEKHHWRKFALWEEATRTPLLWVAPGVTRPDSVCDRTVDLMSVYPTLMELCGIQKPGHLRDPSIVPLLKNPRSRWETPALCTYRLGNHMVRTEEWRYIRYANGDEELYDQREDPLEWKNLAGDPGQSAVKARLAALLPKENRPDIGNGRVGNRQRRQNRDPQPP